MEKSLGYLDLSIKQKIGDELRVPLPEVFSENSPPLLVYNRLLFLLIIDNIEPYNHVAFKF